MRLMEQGLPPSPPALCGWRRGFTGTIALVVLAIALRLVFFVVSLHNLPVTSDEASNYLLAQDIAAGARPLLFIGQPYQFPADAYLYSLFVHLLPHTPLGARIIPFVLSLFTIGISAFALCRAVPPGHRWPGLLLILFPSSYLLCLQSAYYIPQYTTFFLLVSLLTALVVLAARKPQRVAPPLLAGLIGGFAFSSHMLTLSLLVGAALVCCAGARPMEILRRSFCFVAGLVLGLIPYLWAELTIEGANAAVTSQQSLAIAAHKFLDPVLSRLLPGALGANPPVFPDFDLHLEQGAWLSSVASGLFVFVLLAATINRIWVLISQIRQRLWPLFNMIDAAVVIAWICLILCALSDRSQATSHRYALPAVLVLPYLLCLAPGFHGQWMRQGMLAVAVVWALFNVGASLALISTWTKEEHLTRAADTPPIDALLRHLDEKKITHVYASFWLTYRIPFATGGRIQSAQLYNDRFAHWSVPYKENVDQASDFALVLPTKGKTALIRKVYLFRDLKSGGFDYVQDSVGPDGSFLVLRDIRHKQTEGATLFPTTGMRCRASDNSEAASRLIDGNRSSMWSSGERQRSGMWLQCDFSRQTRLNRLVLYNRLANDNSAPLFHVLALHEGQWTSVGRAWSGKMDRFRIERGRPFYENGTQTIMLNEAAAEAIRIEIAAPLPDRAWMLEEMEIYQGGESQP